MTAANYPTCLAILLKDEGGYVNSSHDPGGATDEGVTQAVYNAWRRSKNLPVRSVRAIEPDEVATIYAAQYWAPVRGDELFAGLDLVMFNIAVMDGPVEAIKLFQEALGVPVDGQFGIQTLGALADMDDRADLIGKVCGDEMSFLRMLKNWVYFGVGWGNRYTGLKQQALTMLRNSP